MPKQERNKQFVEIEKKICTAFSVQGISTEKAQIHFDEIKEIKTILETEFGNLGMSLSEGIRWLYLRWLSVNNKIPVTVEKRKYTYLTAEDLEMTEEQCNIAQRRSDFYRGRKQRESALNGGIQ